MGNFLPLRHRIAKKILKALDIKVATGPDMLPARIFKMCADQLSLPIVLLARLAISTGQWPEIWRLRWVIPLFKKGARHDPSKYRGVHLTTVISKAVERLLGSVLVPFLERVTARDLLALLTTTWLWKFERGSKIGAFLSDISGAFDRVPSGRLVKKLLRAGVSATVANFFVSYLSERLAGVAVGGVFSEFTALANMVFQGTVLGPPLWNVFFADVAKAVNKNGFCESVFA